MTGDPDTLTALSERSTKHVLTFVICCESLTKIRTSQLPQCGSMYLYSNGGSALCVLLHCCVWVCRGTQVLVRDASSIEGWQDGHSRPGGALDDERVSFTGMSRVVLQDGVQIRWKQKQKLILLSPIPLTVGGLDKLCSWRLISYTGACHFHFIWLYKQVDFKLGSLKVY